MNRSLSHPITCEMLSIWILSENRFFSVNVNLRATFILFFFVFKQNYRSKRMHWRYSRTNYCNGSNFMMMIFDVFCSVIWILNGLLVQSQNELIFSKSTTQSHSTYMHIAHKYFCQVNSKNMYLFWLNSNINPFFLFIFQWFLQIWWWWMNKDCDKNQQHVNWHFDEHMCTKSDLIS